MARAKKAAAAAQATETPTVQSAVEPVVAAQAQTAEPTVQSAVEPVAATQSQTAQMSPNEKFAMLVEHYKTLPAGDPNAFLGKNPDSPASNYQRDILSRMNISFSEATTKLEAHASMKAFADIDENTKAMSDTIWAQKAAENAAAKAAKPAATQTAQPTQDTKPGLRPKFDKTQGYQVATEDLAKPATYFQIVQLSTAEIRDLKDPSPVPTRAEVAEKLNALEQTDKAKYDKAMSVANGIVHGIKGNPNVPGWKHKAPSEPQIRFAEALGVKVTPFTPAANGIAQKGSTAYSVGEKIHNFKAENLEAFTQAKAQLDAKYAAENAAKKATKAATVQAPTASAAPVAKPNDIGAQLQAAGLNAKLDKALASKAAGDAARNGTTPMFTVPTAAPAKQAEDPQAGE